jgi:hypothetical protein
MKNTNSYLFALSILLCSFQSGFCQSTSTGFLGFPNRPINPGTDYLGWDNTVAVPLEIKHENNRPIRFYTNAGNGTFLNQRMIIDADPGHIGIGLNHLPGNDVLDILPDVNFPNTGIGINNETVLHN